MSKCGPVWILKLQRRVEGNMRLVHFGWTHYDITDGIGMKYTACH